MLDSCVFLKSPICPGTKVHFYLAPACNRIVINLGCVCPPLFNSRAEQQNVRAESEVGVPGLSLDHQLPDDMRLNTNYENLALFRLVPN